MKQKQYIRIIILFGLLLFGLNASFSQSQPEVFIISDKVGPAIDSTEKVNYLLFPEYSSEEFKVAIFYKYPDGKKIAKIYLKNSEIIDKVISEEKYKEYQKQINKRMIKYSEIDTTYIYRILLIDESVLFGRFIDIREKEIVFESMYLGTFTISKIKILKIIKSMPLSDFQNQKWFENPHSTRHFFAPTARSLQKGEGYYQNVYLLLNFVNYGITDNILIGGGATIIPGIGIEEQGYFLNPKVGFKVKDKLHLGGGAFFVLLPNDSDEGSGINAGILYGVSTYGTEENNISLGMGYAYSNEGSLDYPIAMIGGMYRISRRMAFVSENWVTAFDYTTYREEFSHYEWWPWHEGDTEGHIDDIYNEFPIHKKGKPIAIVCYGIRFFSEKLCVDVGFFNILGEFARDELELGEFYLPGIPYLDFVVKF